MEEVKTYDATVERTDNGWAIYVPAVDRYTWTPHLREIDEMARDLVQVMTDEPLDEIAVNVELPAEFAEPIKAMQRARATATGADAAAREYQRVAATTLRGAGAPLRDIAAAIGVSHQRVHQVLADADERAERLTQFARWAERRHADYELPVTADDGTTPIVVALSDELFATLTERLRDAGWNANVFVSNAADRVDFMAVTREECAIAPASDDMTAPDDRPADTATVGMFLEYVRTQEHGVVVSAAAPDVYAKQARTIELADR